MGLKPVRQIEGVSRRRDSLFSYTCHACCRCCHDKIIQLNPYEVARLARNRGITTTEFLSKHTDRSGTALNRVENGACVFLTAQGCGVHEDRPLVCRLYPLGRKVNAEGKETFHEVQPHPDTEGEYGTQGRVEEFLERQGAGPFIDAVDRYVDVVGRMSAALAQVIQGEAKLSDEIKIVADRIAGDQKDIMTEWNDMDLVVRRYCDQHRLEVPVEVEEQMALHIKAIDEWVESK